jgi:hypothetical protein
MTTPQLSVTTAETDAATKSPIIKRTLLHSRPGDWSTNSRDHEIITLTTTRANGWSGPGVRIVWQRFGEHTFNGEQVPVSFEPQVELYHDNWLAFTDLRDVFDALARFDSHVHHGMITAEAVKSAMLSIGFEEVCYPVLQAGEKAMDR